ncbi:MAG: hypothetical protein U0797_17000 [Gemmataceae bacterium]
MSTEVEPRRPSLWAPPARERVALAALLAALRWSRTSARRRATPGRLQAALDALDEAEPGWRPEDWEAAHPAPPASENAPLSSSAPSGRRQGYTAPELDETPAGLARLDAEPGEGRLLAGRGGGWRRCPRGGNDFDRTLPPPLWRFTFPTTSAP